MIVIQNTCMNAHMSFIMLGIFVMVVAIVSITFAAPTAELQRSVGSDVVADTSAAVQLIPSGQYGMVEIESEGSLSVSPNNVGADSINSNANLVLGSTDNPNQDYAFQIKNPSVDPAVYNLRLQQSVDYSGTAQDVQYIVQKNSQTPITINADGTQEQFTLNPNDTLYISIEYNTQDIQTGNLDTTFRIDSTVNS